MTHIIHLWTFSLWALVSLVLLIASGQANTFHEMPVDLVQWNTSNRVERPSLTIGHCTIVCRKTPGCVVLFFKKGRCSMAVRDGGNIEDLRFPTLARITNNQLETDTALVRGNEFTKGTD